jgi:signal transduction histidine kinase
VNTAASSRTNVGRVLLIVGIVVLAVCLVLLILATPPQRHATFRLAIGPQMAISQGLGGSAAQGGPRAYMEALEAIAGVRVELRRAPSIESAVAQLRAGQVDGVAFSLPSTRSLLPSSAVISAPFYTGTSVLVTRRTSVHTSLAALAGRRVAVIDNGEYRAYLASAFPDIEVLPLASPADMLAALDSGAADAALGADGILVPLTRRDHGAILQVHAAPDGPPVELRIASVPNRAVEVSMAHQALLALPSDIHQDILERTLNAVHRAPPTLRAVATYYRTPIILFCLVMLAILLSISRAYRKARRTAARQAAAARVLTLVNHEVRNSAAAVISAIDLAEGEPTPSQREQHFTSARSAADALRHTLTNALEFMFHEASQRSCERSSHSAQAVLEECISGMRPLALSKGVGLSLALDGPDAAVTQCDARALHHIASNLISNAIKFSDAGAVGIRLGFLRGVGELGRVADPAPRAGYDTPSSETHIERLLVSCKAGFVAARTSFHSTVGALPVPFLCVDRVRAYLHEKHRG